jgi:hypothetical protein
MTTLSLMVTIWAVLAVAFVALMIYRGNLTQHETDQLFLNDEAGPSISHQENDEIVRRVNAIQPICKGVGGLTAVMTLAIAGMWVQQLLVGAHF